MPRAHGDGDAACKLLLVTKFHRNFGTVGEKRGDEQHGGDCQSEHLDQLGAGEPEQVYA